MKSNNTMAQKKAALLNVQHNNRKRNMERKEDKETDAYKKASSQELLNTFLTYTDATKGREIMARLCVARAYELCESIANALDKEGLTAVDELHYIEFLDAQVSKERQKMMDEILELCRKRHRLFETLDDEIMRLREEIVQILVKKDQ